MPPTPEPGDGPDERPGDGDPGFLGAYQRLAERLRAGEPVDEAAIRRAYPRHAAALCEALPGLRAVAALAAEARGCDPEPLPGTALADYTILRPLGRGGMGAVYEAWQPGLRRHVAVKVLDTLDALDPRRRKRFLREALAVAALDHGHIVPIYDVAASAPRPFYVMKCIRGHSLAEVLGFLRRSPPSPGDGADAAGGPPPESLVALAARLGADALRADDGRAPGPLRIYDGPGVGGGLALPPPGAPPTASPGWPGRAYARAVARLGRDAASALQHAHDHGVVHRDIKPGNLLLDLEGRLWVTDFGLAWLRGQESTSRSAPTGGTLAYMSPEQLSPEHAVVDHRTDVYSLGVTLYELLTLRRPHAVPEDRPERALARLLGEEPPPPRRLNPAVPRDLETIVLKAMEPEAPRRYATAGDLADDLRRFLDGGPIRARRASLGDRASKWAVRHRAGLMAWGASVVLLLALMVGVLAEQNRRMRRAEGAMGELLGHVSRSSEDLVQGMPPGSDRTHSYYTNMVRFFEAARQRAGPEADVLLQWRTALMHHNLARSSAERSDYRGAVAHFSRAIELLRPLQDAARGRPEGRWIRFDLFRCLMGRSPAHARLRDGAGAVADGEEALRVVADLVRDEPGDPDWLAALGNQHKDLAFLFVRGMLGADEAERHAREAIRIARQVTRMDPEKPQHLFNLHWAHWALAALYSRLGRDGPAEAEYRAAEEAAAELVRRRPGDWGARASRVDALAALAEFLIERGRHAEAEAPVVEALEASGPLVAAYPENAGYLACHLGLKIDLGAVQHATGRADRAEATYREAIARLEEFCRAHPGHEDARTRLEGAYAKCPVASLRDADRARALRAGDAEGAR